VREAFETEEGDRLEKLDIHYHVGVFSRFDHVQAIISDAVLPSE
jgi:hypothetical protein